MLATNLKIALRSIWKNKVFSAINIVGLALSIACCLVISLYIYTELNYDSFHKKISNIYRITEKQNQAGVLYNVAVTPGPLAPALQKDFPEIVNTVRFGSWSGLLKNGKQSFEENRILLTDNSIFSVFNFPLLKGNAATALLQTNGIVITESIADKYFGKEWRTNPNILGQTFRFNNETDFTLTGIAKNLPENSSIQFDILLPLSYLFKADEWSYKWNSNNYHTYVELKQGTNLLAFSKKIECKLHTYNTETKDLLLLQPLKDQYLHSVFDFGTDWGTRSDIKYINIFTGVGLLLLIIACVNFINLSTARSLKRAMEVGIRKVNGASKKQLVAQFLTESVMMAFFAGIVGLFIIVVTQPLVYKITGINLQTTINQPELYIYLLGFIIVIGLLAGFYPALILSAFNPIKVFKKTTSIGSGKLFRKALVVTQFTISAILITCTFFMYRQLKFIQQKDLGFDKEQLLSIRLGGQLKEKSGFFKKDLQTIPGIAGVSPATMSMVNVGNSSYVEWEGMQTDDKFLITQANVDPDFIPTVGISLTAGQNFLAQKTNDTANYIVNESAVKRMGYTTQSAIGKQLTFWGAKGTIIGVVKDFNFKPLNTNIEPFILRYQPQDRYFNLFVKISAGNPSEILHKIETLYKKYDQEYLFEYRFVSDAITQSYSADNRLAAIILLFATLTIFVGCLGLFGLAVFSAEQRTKEIGIRKVLGASVLTITNLLSKDFINLVVTAIAIAIPIALYATTKWLDNYAYRISVDWWVFALTAAGIIGIALLTVSFQAIKAASANPIKSLRSE